jgi:membrane protease YdiL (CAAX protease family)
MPCNGAAQHLTPIIAPLTSTLMASAVPLRGSAAFRALLFLLFCSPAILLPHASPVAHPLVLVAIVLAISYAFLRNEGRSLSVLGLEASWRRVREAATGFVGGAALILVVAACIGISLPFPWARNPHFSGAAMVFSLLWLLSSNAAEELIFRGYSFERLIASIGLWKAQVVTAALFAIFHLANGWSWQAALMGTTIGSLLFGMVFVRWRSVPAATGVHAAVNWTRDLLLNDPPTPTTLFAPLSPRPWTSGEQFGTLLIMDGAFALASIVLWRSYNASLRRGVAVAS